MLGAKLVKVPIRVLLLNSSFGQPGHNAFFTVNMYCSTQQVVANTAAHFADWHLIHSGRKPHMRCGPTTEVACLPW